MPPRPEGGSVRVSGKGRRITPASRRIRLRGSSGPPAPRACDRYPQVIEDGRTRDAPHDGPSPHETKKAPLGKAPPKAPSRLRSRPTAEATRSLPALRPPRRTERRGLSDLPGRDAGGADADPATLAPIVYDLCGLQVREPPAPRLVVSVAHPVAGPRPLPADLTDTCHRRNPEKERPLGPTPPPPPAERRGPSRSPSQG